MNTFLMAEVPLGDNHYVAIIQTIPPQAIIECIEGHDEFTTPYRHYSFVNIHEETEDWTLRVHYLHNEPSSGPDPECVDKLLKRALRYFQTYMNSEDRQKLNQQYL